jgi:hypothetical protein
MAEEAVDDTLLKHNYFAKCYECYPTCDVTECCFLLNGPFFVSNIVHETQ